MNLPKIKITRSGYDPNKRKPANANNKTIDLHVEEAYQRFQEILTELSAQARRMMDRRKSGLIFVKRRVKSYHVVRAAYDVPEHDGYYWVKPKKDD